MNARELVAWNVRVLRTRAGLSQEALAADTEIDRAYVSEVERSLVGVSVDVLDRLARALKVPVAALLTEPVVGEMPPVRLRSGRKSK